MASLSPYKNNSIDSYTEKFINKEFLNDYNLKPSDIVRAVDYKRNINYEIPHVRFYIDLFICFFQNGEYNIHHYSGECNWTLVNRFNFIFCKLTKFPFTSLGKSQVDDFFVNINRQYENKDFLI